MTTVKFGLSTTFPCGYLDDENERLLVYLDEQPLSPILYSALQSQGFRRSESYVYRPYCENCQACQSIRVPVHKFAPSRSQKRIQNKNRDFHSVVSATVSEDYYPLYERYVNEKHLGGVMYPANSSQLDSFTNCDWMQQLFVELYDKEKLIAVAICDLSPDSVSAVYTFYDPDYLDYSLGTYMVLKQVELAKHLQKSWLYLGYYIKQCDKMNYKTRFFPHQILQDGKWLQINSTRSKGSEN